MVLAGVVHHKVQAQADARPAAGVGQVLQAGHGAQLGLDGPEVGDGVAPVAAALGGLEQGHQVEVVHPALLDVLQLVFHTLQIAGEGVHIEHHAQQLPAAVPVGVGRPAGVLIPEGLLPLPPALSEHPNEVVEGLLVVVELHVQPFQLLKAAGQPDVKHCLSALHRASPPLHETEPESRALCPYYSIAPRSAQGPNPICVRPAQANTHRDMFFGSAPSFFGRKNAGFTFCTNQNPCACAHSMKI